jgi:YD repeat-containing protein
VLGLEKKTRNANGDITTLEYDAAARLSKETDPQGNYVTYTYYPSGLPYGKINGQTGQVMVEFAYDPQGRLLSRTYQGGQDVFTYRPNGLLWTAPKRDK